MRRTWSDRRRRVECRGTLELAAPREEMVDAMKPVIRRVAGDLAAFDRLTRPQRTAIMALSFAVPVHQTRLRTHHQVNVSTLHSLARCKLVRRISLFEHDGTVPLPFYTLTQRGDELKRAARKDGRL